MVWSFWCGLPERWRVHARSREGVGNLAGFVCARKRRPSGTLRARALEAHDRLPEELRHRRRLARRGIGIHVDHLAADEELGTAMDLEQELHAAASEARDASCDTEDGAGDGVCDACPLIGGVTTEDEMFLLLGNYFVKE